LKVSAKLGERLKNKTDIQLAAAAAAVSWLFGSSSLWPDKSDQNRWSIIKVSALMKV
jgi:hypothetical protein